jgi:hypothetical protein
MSFLIEVIIGGALTAKAPPSKAMAVHLLTNTGELIKYTDYNF